MEQFIIGIGILLLLGGLVSLIFLYVSLKRALSVNEQLIVAISTLEEENALVYQTNSNFELWFNEFKLRVVDSYQRIKSIDASGHFEADDEVGYFFKELKSLIERLHELGIMDEIEKQDAEKTNDSKITTEELQNILSKKRAAIPITSRKKE